MLSCPGSLHKAVRMEKQQVDNDSRLSLDQRFSGGVRPRPTRPRHQSLDRRFTRAAKRRQRRTVKRHRGHWVSGPLALMRSKQQLQDLSARPYPSLCLCIASPMSLASTRTTLISLWNSGHWVSGPPALIIDYLQPHRLQSPQWTMRANYL